MLQPGIHARNGAPQLLSEAVATFGLIVTILLGLRHRPNSVPVLVAAYIFAAYWFTASTSFANPAVTHRNCLLLAAHKANGAKQDISAEAQRTQMCTENS